MNKLTTRPFLLLLLAVVTLFILLQRNQSHHWQQPLRAVIYPLNADNRLETGQYIRALSNEHFESVELFLRREAERYALPLDKPVEVELGPLLVEHPPLPPVDGNRWRYLIWSLQMRFWNWQRQAELDDAADIRIYLRFFSPHQLARLTHSVGLKQGRIGLVNGFAAIDLQPQNNYVIAHELLHTLGASDKYDSNTRLPLFPEGYAEPALEPRLPQTKAEIMGGWIPVTIGHAVLPASLDQAVVGEKTAQEVGWR